MGSVTACMMDCVTEKSGHVMTGMAVSVCLTPAAPSPLPLPYPTIATVSEGIMDPCLRTKFDGAKVLTVGGCTKNCHGNEPGTLKEVVSLNTAGPCPPVLGAPIVFVELGMAGITGSFGPMNKLPIPGVGGSASGAGGGGGGGGGAGGGAGGPGGSSTKGASNAGGGGGGSSSKASPPNAPAPPKADGQATGGHPVDVVTGTMFTAPEVDFSLPGVFYVEWERTYRTSNVNKRCGLGWGWSHSLYSVAERRGDTLTLVDHELREHKIPVLSENEAFPLGFGANAIGLAGGGVGIDLDDGLFRVLEPDADLVHYRLRELRDAANNVATVEWDEGEVIAIVDTVGRRAELRREGTTRHWSLAVTDAEGNEHRRHLVTYELDERGDLIRVVDRGGAEWRYEYDDEHYLVRERRPDALEYVFRYEHVLGQKRCVETWGEIPGRDVLAEIGAPEAGTSSAPRGLYHTLFEYGPEPFTTKMTDGCGNVHRYRTNEHGLVEIYTDPRGYTERFRYDENGRLLEYADGAGRRGGQQIDPFGRVTMVTNQDGTKIRITYDDENKKTAVIWENGSRIVEDAKDPARIEQTDEGGRKTVFEYGDRGLVASVTHPNGVVETYEYDAHGNLVKHADGLGVTLEYEWDLYGQVRRVKAESGLEYGLRYDSRGSVAQILGPFDRSTRFATNLMGQVVEETSTPGGTTTSRYVAGKLREHVFPDGSRYQFGYDALLRLRWIENPAGERYVRDYDPAGNISRETTFANVTTTYEYDGASQIAVMHKDGLSVRFDRDGEGRILKKEHSTGKIERYVYDERGGLTYAESGGVSVRFERDPEGRTVREVTETTGWRFAVDYEYDAMGCLVKTRYSSGWGVSRERFVASRRVSHLALLSGDAPPKPLLAKEYDERGYETRRTRLDVPCTVAFEREEYGLPTRMIVQGEGGAPLHERAFTWSPLGPTASVTDSKRGSRAYELDVIGRPVSARGLGADERFSYAPAGTAVDAKQPGWAVSRDGRPASTDRARFTWDSRGRLAARFADDPLKSWQYAYDENDQLVMATRGDGLAIRYLYDPLGRRIATSFGDGSSVWFGWDGDSIVEERATRGGVVRRIFEDDGYTPLVETDSRADLRAVLTDAASTPWGYIGSDLAISTVELTTWGEVCDRTGEIGALRFAGQRADELTGLHYNRHRYYAPDLHVFLTPDPLQLLSTMQDIGFLKNPTIFIDPLGLTVIVTGAPGDSTIKQNVRQLQAENPGAKVIRSDRLGKPRSLWQVIKGEPKDVNMIDPNETHVILTTHGAPGSVDWKKGILPFGSDDGTGIAKQLKKAGFNGKNPGAKIELLSCNGATPGKGGKGPSVAENIAKGTGASTWGARANTPGDPYKNPPVYKTRFRQDRPWYRPFAKPLPDPNDPSKPWVENGKEQIRQIFPSTVHEGEFSGTPKKGVVHGGKYVEVKG